jgi:hypothetical protein
MTAPALAARVRSSSSDSSELKSGASVGNINDADDDGEAVEEDSSNENESSTIVA